MPFEQVQSLPHYSELTPEFVQPNVESNQITISYLDFLREQIGRNRRGEEWISLLQKRLNALNPYKQMEVFTIMLRSGRQSCTVLMDATTYKIFHWEIFL